MGDNAVYVQTNHAAENEVVAYRRFADGKLAPLARYKTGGRGTGRPHLASQGSVVLTGDGRWLLVANTGSDDVTVFEVVAGGVRLADRVASGGRAPTSIAAHEALVYVLNSGGEDAAPNIAGFTIADGRLTPLDGSTRPLSTDGADPAQIAFSPDGRTLVVTERGTNSISAYAIDDRGYADGPATVPSPGATPYGFDFANGALVVTEAFGGDLGAAAASSYVIEAPGRLATISKSVGDTRSEVCWAAATKDGRFVYVTNFGDGTISSYSVGADGALELFEQVAASTRLGQPGVRDEALTRDGRYLYAIDADARKVYGWAVEDDGRLTAIGDVDGLPETVAGLAAS